MKDKITIYKLIRAIIVIILCIIGITAGFITKTDKNTVSSVCLCLAVMVYTCFTNKIEDLYDEKLKKLSNKIEEKTV